MDTQNIPIQIAMETGASMPLEMLKAIQLEVQRMSAAAAVDVQELEILVKNQSGMEDESDTLTNNDAEAGETFFLKVEPSDTAEGISIFKVSDVQLVKAATGDGEGISTVKESSCQSNIDETVSKEQHHLINGKHDAESETENLKRDDNDVAGQTSVNETSSGTDQLPQTSCVTDQIPQTSCGTDQLPQTSCGTDQIPQTSCGTDQIPQTSSGTDQISQTSSGTDQTPPADTARRPTRKRKPNAKYEEGYILQKNQRPMKNRKTEASLAGVCQEGEDGAGVCQEGEDGAGVCQEGEDGAGVCQEGEDGGVSRVADGESVIELKEACTEAEIKQENENDGEDQHAGCETEAKTSEVDDVLICKKCKKTFASKGQIDGHSCSKKVHMCAKCGKSFQKPYLLRQHMERVHDPNYVYQTSRYYNGNKKKRTPSKCDICQKVLNSSAALKVHLKLHSNDREFVCPICEMAFIQKSNMLAHIRSVHEQQQYLCRTCGESFQQKAGLLYHERNHIYAQRLSECLDTRPDFDNLNNQQVSCLFCDETFQHIIRYLHHLRGHLEEDAYLETDTVKKAKVLLAKNEDILSEAKVLSCSICKKIFFNKSGLKEHEKSHSLDQVYSYKCKFCDKIFSSLSGCKYHQKTHKDKYGIQCGHCKKVFVNLAALVRHCKQYHEKGARLHPRSKPPPPPDRFTCSLCAKSFRTKYNYNVHLRTHNKEKCHTCPLCQKTFTDPSNLIAHGKRSHPDSPRHLFSTSKRLAYIHRTSSIAQTETTSQ